MTATKILYVDDEAMALKYFERLVGPIAPVITANSVQEGQQVLQERGDEIAVLVSDQRMPGAHGNELLRYAREHHPRIVRMLTTAYSEMGEAIEAINAGEIFRYITKPWDLESLRADLKNALELAELRGERDSLLREKMLVQQQQLLASRIGQLALVCAGFASGEHPVGLAMFLDSMQTVGCKAPAIDWRRLDHADLTQSEVQRGTAVGQLLVQWQQEFGEDGDHSPRAAQALLARALPGCTSTGADGLLLTDRGAMAWLLEAPAQEEPTPERVAWLAWLLWLGRPVQLYEAQGGWALQIDGSGASQLPLPPDWLADAIDAIGRNAI